jgi:alpha-tubulin suppressor-like RCC1 family protein
VRGSVRTMSSLDGGLIRLGLWVGSMLAAGCEGKTQLILLMRSDFAIDVVGAPDAEEIEIDSVYVEASADGELPLEGEDGIAPLGDGGPGRLTGFPRVLPIVRGGRDPGPLDFQVVAGLGEESIVEWDVADLSFVPGRTHVALFDLTEACAGMSCPIGCRAGRCVNDVLLPGYTGELPVFDECAERGEGAVNDFANSREHCGGCRRPCDGACVEGACEPGAITDLASSARATCALRTDGASGGILTCWGGNASGELGILPLEDFASQPPRQWRGQPRALAIRGEPADDDPSTPPLVRFRAIDGGLAHFCAIDVGGDLWCWGSNARGQLGIEGEPGEPAAEPSDLAFGGATEVDAGLAHTCVLAGEPFCWGDNVDGQVTGTPTTTVIEPDVVEELALETTTAITAGGRHTCAILAERDGQDNAVVCWGANDREQLGAPDPFDVVLSGATEVEAGFEHTCAVVEGGVRCWGSNASRALGTTAIPDTATSAEPLAVAGLPSLPDGRGPWLSASIAFDESDPTLPVAAVTCAITTGGLFCWGANDEGQAHPGPEPEVDLPGMTTVIAPGGRHSCALVGGEVWCWGANALGQRGLWSADGLTVRGSDSPDSRLYVPTRVRRP